MLKVGLAPSSEKDLPKGEIAVGAKVKRKVQISHPSQGSSGVLLLKLLLSDSQPSQVVMLARLGHKIVSVGGISNIFEDLAIGK